MTAPTRKYEVGFNWSGDDTTFVDESASTKHLATKLGRNEELGKVEPGTAIVVLENEDGRFTPEYVAGPLYGLLELEHRVRIRGEVQTIAATIGAATTAASVGAGATLTFSHAVPAGDNRLLLVRIAVRSEVGGAQLVSSVTFNGDPLTKAGRSAASVGVSAEIWYLVAPDVATGDVVITLAASEQGIVAEALNLTNVNQVTPIGTFVSYNNSGDNAPTVAATSATGEIVFDALGTYDSPTVAATTVGAGQTQDSNLTEPGSTGQVRLSTSHEDGAASVTMSWSTSSSPIVALAAVPVLPSVYKDLFYGFIEDIEPDSISKRVSVFCKDWALFLQAFDLNLGPLENKTTGFIIGAILDEVGFPSGGTWRDLDVGQTTLTHWHARNINAWDAIQEVAEHELGGMFYFDQAGKAIFEDRHARALSVVVNTWTNTIGYLVYRRRSNQVYAKAKIGLGGFEEGIAGSTIYSHSPIPFSLAPGETKRLNINYSQPAKNVITPASGTDYSANAASDGSGADLTASVGSAFTNYAGGATWSLTNNHASSTMYFQVTKIRGTPLGLSADLRTVERTGTALGVLSKTFERQYRFLDDPDLGGHFAEYIVNHFSSPQPLLEAVQPADDATLQEQLYESRLSDRQDITDTVFPWRSHVDNDFFIEMIEHVSDIPTEGEGVHKTKWVMTAQGADAFWIWGTSRWGIDTIWGY